MNEHQQKYLRQEKCTFNYYRESDNMDGFLFNVFWKTQMRRWEKPLANKFRCCGILQ